MRAILKRIPLPPFWVRRRIGFSVMVLMGAIVINFIIPRAMPGDITFLYTSSDMDPMVANQILRDLGLDKSQWYQFVVYLKNCFTLQFGNSFFYRTDSVISLIGEALPRTLLLLIPAQLLSITIGYFLGVISGWKAGSKKDSFITGSSLVIWAMPMFWTAMVVLYVGGYMLEWFPLRGYKTINVELNAWGAFVDRLKYIILPTIALAAKFGVTQLVMRNTMTISLKQNYVTTARAKGLSERRVKHRHAARNALMPTVTSAAMRFATLVAGLIFIEKVFSYPGMGKLILEAVLNNDYPVLQACFLAFAAVTIVTIFILDLVYARLDPRVRYE